MQNNSKRVLFGLLAGFCITAAAKVVTDYSHSTDFSHYKTYSWVTVEAGNPLWTDRIKTAVDSQLTAKGWSLAPAGDAAVSAFGSTQKQPRLQTFYEGLGGGWYWRGFGDGTATTTVDYQPVGTLVVDIFDAPTKKLIWRGMASEALSDKPDKNEKKLDKTAEEMFKSFPPKSKG